LPYSNKINFINRSQPRARSKNNLSDYLMNTIKQKFNTTNRFKATDRTKSLKEVALKDKRLMQICADIEAFHEMEKMDELCLNRSHRLRSRVMGSPEENEELDLQQLPSISHKMEQLARPMPLCHSKETAFSPLTL